MYIRYPVQCFISHTTYSCKLYNGPGVINRLWTMTVVVPLSLALLGIIPSVVATEYSHLKGSIDCTRCKTSASM
jgi:hypothetical protein